jgi:hypothetical protein
MLAAHPAATSKLGGKRAWWQKIFHRGALKLLQPFGGPAQSCRCRFSSSSPCNELQSPLLFHSPASTIKASHVLSHNMLAAHPAATSKLGGKRAWWQKIFHRRPRPILPLPLLLFIAMQ